MKILTFYDSIQAVHLGIEQENKVVGVAKAAAALNLADVPTTPSDFYKMGLDVVKPLRQLLDKLNDTPADVYLQANRIEVGPAVPAPGKIICVGLNYRRHAEESGMTIPREPVLFSKYNNMIAPPENLYRIPTPPI
jgi:2-keto-4-pentenoate hydratase/2-oxohepta-3-ene-1,7-dioic acid hydratase in catechol pathway